jgi:outer membrane lipoprotein-sorting protein
MRHGDGRQRWTGLATFAFQAAPVKGSRRASVRSVVTLTALCAGVWLAASAPVAVAPQHARTPPDAASPAFDDLYRRGQALNKDLKTLTARFVETTTTALLEKPLVERGMLYVERPSRVALHYSDPPDRQVIIDGKWMTTLWPSVKVNRRTNIGAAQDRVQKYFVEGDAGELRRIFDIDLHATSTRPGSRELFMTPKQKRISESLKRLDLWVTDPGGLLEAMRMTFANGDIKLMEFENVAKNVPVDPAVFVVPKP